MDIVGSVTNPEGVLLAVVLTVISLVGSFGFDSSSTRRGRILFGGLLFTAALVAASNSLYLVVMVYLSVWVGAVLASDDPYETTPVMGLFLIRYPRKMGAKVISAFDTSTVTGTVKAVLYLFALLVSGVVAGVPAIVLSTVFHSVANSLLSFVNAVEGSWFDRILCKLEHGVGIEHTENDVWCPYCKD